MTDEYRTRLTPFCDGLVVAQIATEHEANEIAAILHLEMLWMATVIEAVWHGLHSSVLSGAHHYAFPP